MDTEPRWPKVGDRVLINNEMLWAWPPPCGMRGTVVGIIQDLVRIRWDHPPSPEESGPNAQQEEQWHIRWFGLGGHRPSRQVVLISVLLPNDWENDLELE